MNQPLIDSVVDAENIRTIEFGSDFIVLYFKDGGTIRIEPDFGEERGLRLVVIE